MPPLPEEKFINAMKLVVRENLAYVPVIATFILFSDGEYLVQ
jgi:hypothetical protein